MKSKVWLIGLVFLVVFVSPVRLPAEEQKGKHDRYRFVDVGTFGGPASYINGAMALGAFNQINRQGTTVGSSATAAPTSPDSNSGVCGGVDGNLHFIFHAFKWQDSKVTDLGALSGTDNCSVATSINANGDIVGQSENGVVDPLLGVKELRAVLWKEGEIVDLGTFGGNVSLVASINDRGQVAGTATNAIPDPFSLLYQLVSSTNGTQSRAFLWETGNKQDLGTLGGPDAQAFLMNNQGQVVGLSYTNATPNAVTGFPTLHPFLWHKGEMKDLGTLGGFGTLFSTISVNGLNNRGQVIGLSPLAGDQIAHSFLWDDGQLIDLTAQSNGAIIAANAINDAGAIVGLECLPTGVCDAYLWSNGIITDLGVLPGDCTSQAFAINSSGQVVGQSFSCVSNRVRTFLWEEGSMVDLNTLTPSNSGFQLVEAFAINDRGEIGGIGDPPGCANLNDAACGHAFLLIPIDEDETDSSTDIIDGDRAPVSQSPTNMIQGPAAASEAMTRLQNTRMDRRPAGLGPRPAR